MGQQPRCRTPRIKGLQQCIIDFVEECNDNYSTSPLDSVSVSPDNCLSVDGALLAPTPSYAGPMGISVIPEGDGINHEVLSAKSVYDISDAWLRQCAAKAASSKAATTMQINSSEGAAAKGDTAKIKAIREDLIGGRINDSHNYSSSALKVLSTQVKTASDDEAQPNPDATAQPGSPAEWLLRFRSDVNMARYFSQQGNSRDKYTFASMFHGAGMFDLGFIRTDLFKAIWGAEKDADLSRCWQEVMQCSSDSDAMDAKVSKLRPKPTVVLVTPPCTDFAPLGSLLGSMGKTGWMVPACGPVLLRIESACVVFEFTWNIVNVRGGEALNRLKACLRIKYKLFQKEIRVITLGDPSNRKRLFLVGFLEKLYCDSNVEFKWPEALCNDEWFPTVKDLGVSDDQIPKACYRATKAVQVEPIRSRPMQLVKVAQTGTKTPGDCGDPTTVLAPWSILHTAMPSGGGAQLSFQRDGLNASEFKLGTHTYLTPTIMYSRAANLCDDALVWLEKHRPEGCDADEWARRCINQGVPVATGSALAMAVNDHLQLLRVPYDSKQGVIGFDITNRLGGSKTIGKVDELAKSMHDYAVLQANRVGEERHYGLRRLTFDTGASRTLLNPKAKGALDSGGVTSNIRFSLADESSVKGERDGTFRFWCLDARGGGQQLSVARSKMEATTMAGVEDELFSPESFARNGWSPLLKHRDYDDGYSHLYRHATKDAPEASIWCPRDEVNGGWCIYLVASRRYSEAASLELLSDAYRKHQEANELILGRLKESGELYSGKLLSEKALSVKEAIETLKASVKDFVCVEPPGVKGDVVSFMGYGPLEKEFRGIYKRLGKQKRRMTDEEYHERHGHIGVFPGCKICAMIAGCTRRIFTTLVKFVEFRAGYLWHMDICEITVTSLEGFTCLVVLRDKASSVLEGFGLRDQRDVRSGLKALINKYRNDPTYQGYGYAFFSYIKTDNAGVWAENCEEWRDLQAEIGFSTIYSDPSKEEDKGSGEAAVKAYVRCVRSILAQQSMHPMEWGKTLCDCNVLLNLHPGIDGSSATPLDGDVSCPVNKLSRGRISQFKTNKMLSMWVAINTPCLVNVPSVGGSTMAPKVVWKIANGLRAIPSNCAMNLWDPHTMRESHSSSFIAVHLPAGMSWRQYLNYPEEKMAFGDVIVRKESQADIKFKFDLIDSTPGKPQCAPAISGVEVVSSEGRYELRRPPEKIEGLECVPQGQIDDAVSEVMADQNEDKQFEVVVGKSTPVAREDAAELSGVVDVDQMVDSAIIDLEADCEDEGFNAMQRAFDNAEFTSLKHSSYVSGNSDRFVDICRKFDVPFELQNAYWEWCQKDVAESYTRLLGGDLSRTRGHTVTAEQRFYPPFGYQWSKMVAQATVKRLKRLKSGKRQSHGTIDIESNRELFMQRAQLNGIERSIKALDRVVREMLANLEAEDIFVYEALRGCEKANKLGRGTTRKEVSELIRGEYGNLYATALTKEWQGLIDRNVISLNHTKDELIKKGIWVQPVQFSVQLKDKFDENGEWTGVKGRLPIMGCEPFMRRGVHFDETFSSKPRPDTWRLFNAICVLEDLYRLAFDYTMAYTNATRSKPLVLHYPKFFKNIGADGKERFAVVERCLYGDPAADREWGIERDNYTMSAFNKGKWKCVKCRYDPCVFVITVYSCSESECEEGEEPEKGPYTIIGTHTDDTDMLGQNELVMKEIFAIFKGKYDVSLVSVSFMLGIKRDDVVLKDGTRVIVASQCAYIEGVYESWYNFLPKKEVKTVFPVGVTLSLAESELPSEEEYKQVLGMGYLSAVGQIGWGAHHCWPEVLVAYSYLTRVQSKPSKVAFSAAMHVVKWMHQTRTRGISWRSDGNRVMHGTTDSSDVGDKKDGRVQYGGHTTLAGGVVGAWSHKQRDVGGGSATVEYQSFKDAASAMVWAKELLTDMGFEHWFKEPMALYGDNDCANDWAQTGKITKANQYIRRDYHIVMEMVERNVIKILRTGSPSNTADLFTKAVDAVTLLNLVWALCGYEEWSPFFKGNSNADKTYKSLTEEQEHIGFKRKREIELGIANQVLGLASASNQQASK